MNIKFYDSEKSNELDLFVDLKTSGDVLFEVCFTCLTEGVYSSDDAVAKLICEVIDRDFTDSCTFHVCRFGFRSLKVLVLRA